MLHDLHNEQNVLPACSKTPSMVTKEAVNCRATGKNLESTDAEDARRYAQDYRVGCKATRNY